MKNENELNDELLYAAAPDLLNALSAVYADIELNNVDGGSDELNILVQTALSKATGDDYTLL